MFSHLLVVDLGKYAELNAFWFRIGAIVSTSLGILEKSQLFHSLLLFCFILLFVFVFCFCFGTWSYGAQVGLELFIFLTFSSQHVDDSHVKPRCQVVTA